VIEEMKSSSELDAPFVPGDFGRERPSSVAILGDRPQTERKRKRADVPDTSRTPTEGATLRRFAKAERK